MTLGARILAFFSKAAAKKKVQRPGSRGGKYFIDKKGDVEYGERPKPKRTRRPVLIGRGIASAVPVAAPRWTPEQVAEQQAAAEERMRLMLAKREAAPPPPRSAAEQRARDKFGLTELPDKATFILTDGTLLSRPEHMGHGDVAAYAMGCEEPRKKGENVICGQGYSEWITDFMRATGAIRIVTLPSSPTAKEKGENDGMGFYVFTANPTPSQQAELRALEHSYPNLTYEVIPPTSARKDRGIHGAATRGAKAMLAEVRRILDEAAAMPPPPPPEPPAPEPGYYDEWGKWAVGARPAFEGSLAHQGILARRKKDDREGVRKWAEEEEAWEAKKRAQAELLDPAIREFELTGKPVEFEREASKYSGPRVDVLHKRPTKAGGYRITYFDESGPMGHQEFETLAPAIVELRLVDYSGRINQGYLDKWAMTPKWAAGMHALAHRTKWDPLEREWQEKHSDLYNTDKAEWDREITAFRAEQDADFEATKPLFKAQLAFLKACVGVEDVEWFLESAATAHRVSRPGSRGGHWRTTRKGDIRYDPAPSGRKGKGIAVQAPMYLSGAVVDAMAKTPGCGYMLTPNMGNDPPPAPWGADTGCFSKAGVSKFTLPKYLAWLAKHDKKSCLFATAPDRVGDAKTTMKLSIPVLPMIRALGLPAALIGQNGMEKMKIPWDDFDVFFIGGDTAWKLGPAAAAMAAEAKRRGKWVHMGRVNSAKRYKYAGSIGCDSVDGTYIAYGPSINTPKVQQWVREARAQSMFNFNKSWPLEGQKGPIVLWRPPEAEPRLRFIKAEQLSLFGDQPRAPVKRPGSRGGHGYYNAEGTWVYGIRPVAEDISGALSAPFRAGDVVRARPDSGWSAQTGGAVRAVFRLPDAEGGWQLNLEGGGPTYLAKDFERGEPPKAAPKPPEQHEPMSPEYVVELPTFKSWFGDWEADPAHASKVVADDTGKPEPQREAKEHPQHQPLRVFHGSHAEFRYFDPAKIGTWNLYGPGFYFTADKEIVEGTFVDESDTRFFDTEEEATNAPGRDYFVWKNEGDPGDYIGAGKWATSVKVRKMVQPGYQHKGNIDLDTDQRQRIADGVRAQLGKRGSGYITKHEEGIVDRHLEEFVHENPTWPISLGDLHGLISEQPYNLNAFDAAEKAGIDLSGHIYECFLNIRNPVDMNKPPPPDLIDKIMAVVTAPDGRYKVVGVPKEALRSWLAEGKPADRIATRTLANEEPKPESAEDLLMILSSHVELEATIPLEDRLRYAEEGEPTEGALRYMNKQDWPALLKAAGYDGITHTGGLVSGGKQHRVWIAFEPTQVKAVGNMGSFDPKDPDIYKARPLLLSRACQQASRRDRVALMFLRLSADGLKKAKQLGLFDAPRKPVEHPGVRGGKGYFDIHGTWQYGDRPIPQAPAVPVAPTAPTGVAQPLPLSSLLAPAQGAFVAEPTPTQRYRDTLPEHAVEHYDPKQHHAWQVLERDFTPVMLEANIKRMARTRGPVWEAKLRDPNSDVGRELRIQLRALYGKTVKKAMSKGELVPKEVVNQPTWPEFRKALDARERYEKGYHTSFGNKSIAVSEQLSVSHGVKIKRQDGTPIPFTQVEELRKQLDELTEAMGVGDLQDVWRKMDVTIAHCNGKMPFLSKAGGLFVPDERTVSVGVRGVSALAHELLGHALDAMSGIIAKYSGQAETRKGKWNTVHYVSQVDSTGGTENATLIREATAHMNDERAVMRIFKTEGANMDPVQRDRLRVLKVSLGHYWRRPWEVWARLTEQYVATVLAEKHPEQAGETGRGRPKGAADTVGYYQDAPGWWSKEQFAKMRPMVEAQIRRRIAIARSGKDPDLASEKIEGDRLKLADRQAQAEKRRAALQGKAPDAVSRETAVSLGYTDVMRPLVIGEQVAVQDPKDDQWRWAVVKKLERMDGADWFEVVFAKDRYQMDKWDAEGMGLRRHGILAKKQ